MPVIIHESTPGRLVSLARHFDSDSRPADVTTFITRQYPQLTERLSAYSRKLVDSHRLAGNYLDYDFKESHIATMYTVDDEIVGFSTGWARDFYPPNSIRLLNRFYQDPDRLRLPFAREFLRPTTFAALQQQMFLAARLGFANAFITRELRAKKQFAEFARTLDERTTHHWSFEPGPFLVAPDPDNRACWQSIILTKLKPGQPFWTYWRKE